MTTTDFREFADSLVTGGHHPVTGSIQ
jgi:hypothetical protein